MSLAAATMPMARPHTPGDEELQELYNEVWEGFKPIQSGHDTESKPIRPLPPTPVTSSSASSPTNGMPEPELHYDSPTTQRSPLSADSTNGSSDLLRKVTTGSTGSGRILPTPPRAGNSSDRPSSGNSSYFPRFSSVSGSNLDVSYTNQNGAGRANDFVPSPYDNSRPYGTSTPRIPGGSVDIDDIYGGDVDDSYVYGDYQPVPPPPTLPPPTSSISEHMRTYSDHTVSGNSFMGQYDPPPMDRNVSGPSIVRDASYLNGYASSPTTYLGLSPKPGFPPSTSTLNRGLSAGSVVSQTPSDYYTYGDATTGPGVNRRPTDLLTDLANGQQSSYVPDDEWSDSEDGDESRFITYSLLSNLAMQLRDKVPRGTHVKGSIPYPRAFTGKDIVSTIQSLIQRELLINHNVPTSDRRAALQVARSLQSQLFFYEVEWGNQVLQDGVEDVYMFLDDVEGSSDAPPDRQELPTGVITILTTCYTTMCTGEGPCYAWSCPKRGNFTVDVAIDEDAAPRSAETGWPENVPPEVIDALPPSEVNRQTIIHKLISKEVQYLQDLDNVDTCFLKPLRASNPPVIPRQDLEEFIDDVFSNILDLRECNRRLLDVMHVRQREQHPVIQRIGDILLDAATEFRLAYPEYVGHLPLAEKRLKDETENNAEFRLFLEQCAREVPHRPGEAMRLDLKQLLNRPSEHLQKYPYLLEAIYGETAHGNPDADFLKEAMAALKGLQSVAQLRTFQSAMGRGVTGKWEWHDLVSAEARKALTKDVIKRQSIIFELIKGEMAYVKDLENIEVMYIRPLRAADPPIIEKERLQQFIIDVFHNFAELHAHHRRLVEKFHEIQREQHPVIRSVTEAMLDAALNFRDAYMEYIPNYPIAAYRIDEEMNNNPAFKAFVEQCVKHPDAHRLDMKSFVNRPIPRLLRYELLLKGIMEESSPTHEDRESIPQVLEIIKSLGKETEPGVESAKQKVELWRYNSNLVFKAGEVIDMDLLDEHRSLIHAGKLLRQPETGFEWNGWSELFVLLFDNYLVMTKTKEKDGINKYHVNRRPIPLDLLTLVNFTDPPTQRGTGILRGLRGGERHDTAPPAGLNGASPESATDSRSVYPMTVHHNGRLGGPYMLYAESQQIRLEWKQKLEEALGLRKVVQESNKVFEVETLSADTFLVPSLVNGATSPAWTTENSFTGKVSCSVPFTTADGRGLVAIGCAEGVWIGFRHDSRSLRRVLHLKQVTQCAMLEEFGIFLVLADKSLFAYHIEALVPSSPQSTHASQTPQKLNGTKDVHFFSVGQLRERTLVIYMKKKGLDSVFRVLEPVVDKINERAKAPGGLSGFLGLRPAKSEWFRIYRDFFLPSESFDLIFLKAKIAILCTKGFEIMDLADFKSVTIPQRDDPRMEKLAKRCESSRPLGMFRSKEDEFLLVYDAFGLYVNKHGDPSRGMGQIEWEGSAERVALHLPYILLFDPRFIEVRHVETGRLAQIIPGNDIRCIWDGRGLNSNASVTPMVGPSGEAVVQEARVHGVMNATETIIPGVGGMGGRQPKAVAQHIFELIPTIPLYLPGSLASPSTTTYFPQSMSPPRSPQMLPTAGPSGWRG
ncbi:hypothetical protein AB1N83_002482 [Pleurotus pulmonarius]